MKLYWIKTNAFVKWIFSKYIWDIPNQEKLIYLTFDDGPTPEITEWTLIQLEKYKAKATFFCIGNNIKKYPDIFNKLINDGHAIGNHTYDHLNGWQTDTKTYLENINSCDKQIQESSNENLKIKIFRPPYGKIKAAQADQIKKWGYKIIMWDVLSADFDQTISPEDCLDNVLSNLKTGSIIVFHDSIKAFKNLEYTLPKTLDYINRKGFKCEIIRNNPELNQ